MVNGICLFRHINSILGVETLPKISGTTKGMIMTFLPDFDIYKMEQNQIFLDITGPEKLLSFKMHLLGMQTSRNFAESSVKFEIDI